MILEWPPVTQGPRRCTCNNLTHILTNQEINLDMFEQAVKATVYNEPHLRADVDLESVPKCWTPAKDFNDLFTFKDLAGDCYKDVGDVWHLVLDEVNHPWSYGSGEPLYRCTLLKVVGGYMVMNCYHHSAGDGTTGMLIMGGIMEHYNNLLAGKVVELNPHPPKPCVEDLASVHSDPSLLQSMVDAKVHRAKNYKPYLPFDYSELENNRSCAVPVNSTIFREGKADNYLAIR
jgi:NRPS condensation-like uncharacterized protein